MPSLETEFLRNRLRQARSAARVELLLDVAAEVFEEVGYDAATTNLVATRADVPVGTLYRWFPDKAALAEALTDRYLGQLVSTYRSLPAAIDPAEPIGDFIRRVMALLMRGPRAPRAMSALLASAMVPGGRSAAGERLRDGLEGYVRQVIELRVPGVPADTRDRAAGACVTLVHLTLASAADDGPHREAMCQEYIDAMLAYIEAKFPDPDHPVWNDSEASVKPAFPAPSREVRMAADDGSSGSTHETGH